LERDDARRDLEVGPDQLEDRPAAGLERLPVEEARLDVVEAAEGEEVVLLVVVEGRFVTEPTPDRIRVGIDLEVVGVVVDGALARDGHVAHSSVRWGGARSQSSGSTLHAADAPVRNP